MKLIPNKKIKRLAFCLALFFYINNVIAQKNYFQQEVNYQISVKLNDNNHSLKAFEKIKYINNDPYPILCTRRFILPSNEIVTNLQVDSMYRVKDFFGFRASVEYHTSSGITMK